MIRFALAAIFAVVCFSPSAEAGNVRGRQVVQQVLAANQIIVPTGFVVTQFAVPVAVPVAPLSYVHYQAGCCNVAMPGMQYPAQPTPQPIVQQPVPSPATSPVQPIPAQPTPAPVQSTPAPQPMPTGPQPEPVTAQSASLVKKYCASCHSGDAPRGSLLLDGSGKIDDSHFRDAISRLMSDDPEKRMPKGSIVPPDELGLLIQELSKLK